MIKRIFHPIGQGAFYSERYENNGVKFNIVYDCGNWRRSNRAKNLVKQSFSPEDTVDILFISHFDFDHVSQIETLKNHVKSIDRVMLPLLDTEEEVFVDIFYKLMDYSDISEIIKNPHAFFDAKTKITYVKGYNGNSDLFQNSIELDQLDEINKINNKIESGTRISIDKKGFPKWI